tara:strand:- start:936 stop:2735 length:1800 start_codon:yes stop_codon:yes gene_type:complete
MAEKIVSPGVFTKEIDQTFLPAAIGDIGAAIIGPTVKGPAMIPTVVNSFSEFEQRFGTTVQSGSSFYQYLTSHTAENYLKSGGPLTVVRILEGSYTPATATLSGSDGTTSLTLTTLSDGHEMTSISNLNDGSSGGVLTNAALISGSKDNLRYEITSRNTAKGTFSLNIRQGNDLQERKQVLESWNNLSLDPNSTNYVGKRIGDKYYTLTTDTDGTTYLKSEGDFAIKSKYVRVTVNRPTPDYLTSGGGIRVAGDAAKIPGGYGTGITIVSGSYNGGFTGGSDGTVIQGFSAQLFYDKITDTNVQGFDLSAVGSGTNATQRYKEAIGLLSNQDEYDFNLLLLPGVNDEDHSEIVSKALDTCETRGDVFSIVDPVRYGRTLAQATTEAATRDSSYGAMYWPWVQVRDQQVGVNRWVPPSVVMSGIYSFNDKVAHPWFAPAGLNRGGIDTAIQAERKLTHSNRDDLYDNNVNPIATFPGQGICAWGQKTLQKKESALDRVNVRRLLIKLKKFIASTSKFLVFEQNNVSTRNKFLNIVNPFLEQVQSNSGLTAFKVIMDDTNNTPDSIDRNILYGQIFIQPTRTAEFIMLDFTVQPTGATFPE